MSHPTSRSQQFPLMEDSSFQNIDIDTIDRLSSALGPRPQTLEEGLYANLAVRPTDDEKLPTYTEAVSESMPSSVLNPIRGVGVYVNPWATDTTQQEEEDVLVDGIPVGPPILLMINALASMAFDLLGFLITFFLATTHAAAEGSRVGLGVTILRYGLFLQRRADYTAEGMSEQEATKAASGGLDEDWVTGNINDPVDSVVYGDEDGNLIAPLPNSSNSTLSNSTLSNSTVVNSTKSANSSRATRKRSKLVRLPINQTDDIFPTPSTTALPTIISATSNTSPTAVSTTVWTMHGGGTSHFNPANYMVSSLFAYALVMTGWLLIFASISRYIRAKKMAEIAMLGASAPATVSRQLVVDPVPVVVPLEQLSAQGNHLEDGIQLEEEPSEMEPNADVEANEESNLTRSLHTHQAN